MLITAIVLSQGVNKLAWAQETNKKETNQENYAQHQCVAVWRPVTVSNSRSKGIKNENFWIVLMGELPLDLL